MNNKDSGFRAYLQALGGPSVHSKGSLRERRVPVKG